MKIMVGVAVGRSYEPDFIHMLYNGLLKMPNVTFYPKVGDALIERSRSVIATYFLEQTDCDILLTMDTDTLMYVDDSVKLCEQAADYDMVAAMYVTRNRDRCAPASFLGREPIVFANDHTPVEIVWAATGALATHRRVFEQLLAKDAEGFWRDEYPNRPMFPLTHKQSSGLRCHPFYETFCIPNPDDPTPEPEKDWIWLSEDYAMCERAKQVGFKVYLNPAVRTSHLGTWAYRLEDMAQKPFPEQEIRLTRFPGVIPKYRAEFDDTGIPGPVEVTEAPSHDMREQRIVEHVAQQMAEEVPV
jgi:hypothetical protein|tara:strand:- start:6341 stop:7243 length:903 start_codon:yes stop_codon:yes gene_type:complete